MRREILFVSVVLLMAAVFLSAGKRDPFVPLVGALERVKISGLEDVVSVDDVKLEGIAVGPGGKKTVVMNGRMLKEGDRAGVVEILKIDNKAVTLLVGGAEYSINLTKEGDAKDELQN